MKLTLEFVAEIGQENAQGLKDALMDAFAMMHWTFGNWGSDNEITKLCAKMKERGKDEITAEDSGSMGWRAAIKIER